jgi:hypothetical protein
MKKRQPRRGSFYNYFFQKPLKFGNYVHEPTPFFLFSYLFLKIFSLSTPNNWTLQIRKLDCSTLKEIVLKTLFYFK